MRETIDEDDRAEVLEYVRGMLRQLQGMAERDRHDMLAYLIGMAYLEADDRARNARTSGLARHQRN
ncbi:MAG: hypothetical protein ACXIVF_19810 [Rhizobiaceae bacterium]